MSSFGRNDICTSQRDGKQHEHQQRQRGAEPQRRAGGADDRTRGGARAGLATAAAGLVMLAAAPVSRSMTQLSTKIPATISVAMALP